MSDDSLSEQNKMYIRKIEENIAFLKSMKSFICDEIDYAEKQIEKIKNNNKTDLSRSSSSNVLQNKS